MTPSSSTIAPTARALTGALSGSVWGMFWICTLAGCHLIGPLDPVESPSADASGHRDANITARRWIDSIQPDQTAISPTPVVRVTWSRYLDDDSFDSYNAARLVSGGLAIRGRADYQMVGRTLVWRPNRSLPRGVRFRLQISEEITDVRGRRLPGTPTLRTYRPTDAPDVGGEESNMYAEETESAPSWSEIDAIFESACRQCHGAKQWDLNPLTRESLVGQPSQQVDRMLVRPYDAPDSYLMHKLLWDYPDRRGSAQPPPWSEEGGDELPTSQLRMIERWIEAGAPP